MTYPDIFGSIKTSDQVEQAAIDTLKLWWPTYSREFELQRGLPRDSLPLPKSYLTADKVDHENADQLPSVVVVSPGLSGKKPTLQGDGTYTALFSVGVGCFVSGKDRNSTKSLTRWYTAIIRAIMSHKQSLGGFSDGVTWLDESYNDRFTFEDQQTVGAGQAIFEVTVSDVVQRWGGPPYPIAPDPDTQPGSQYGEVELVSAVVEIEE
jgi:hypothetical protein